MLIQKRDINKIKNQIEKFVPIIASRVNRTNIYRPYMNNVTYNILMRSVTVLGALFEEKN